MPKSKRTTKSNHQIRSTWLENWRRQSQTQRKENEKKVDTTSGSRCSTGFPWISAFLQQVLQSLFVRATIIPVVPHKAVAEVSEIGNL